MPLIAHSELPSFQRLKKQGETILSKDRAEHQDHTRASYWSIKHDA